MYSMLQPELELEMFEALQGWIYLGVMLIGG